MRRRGRDREASESCAAAAAMCESLEWALSTVDGVEIVLVKGDGHTLHAIVVGGDRHRVRFVACQWLPTGSQLRLSHAPSAIVDVL